MDSVDMNDPEVGGAMADFETPEQRLEALFNAQGGNRHTFIAQDPNTAHYFEATVNNYNHHYSGHVKLSRQVEQFESSLKQYVSDQEIDIDVARDLADCFGITLTREVQYCVQVEFTFTMELEPDTDPYDIIGDLNFDVSTPYGMDAEISDYDAQVIHDQWVEC